VESESSFDTQQSIISQASGGLGLGRNTTFTNTMLATNQTSALNHFQRIADYLELGPDVWYTVESTGIVFHDVEGEPDQRQQGPTKAHFRYEFI
jgi:hypothetical protein